ncbi:hypothetical protein [Martelella alba]|uniref:Uncharacterized protein n=1 Tax=Martelella alba TaxID=2590451 RepID=A0ABY2SL33_9HYPH|nr:hypothetical protein [Martelella alba]TKI06333.1 hypothetical protein FCN80_10870 [Martelella alba]
MIILIMQNGGDPTSWQRRRDVLSEELAALPIAPPVIVAACVPGTNVAHRVSLFRLRPAIRILGRQWPVSLAGYPGGLTAMRTSGIKALLGAMDDCIARAIKTRHKQVSAGEDRLNADYLYWQRDLALLGDRLRTRINGYRQR